MFIYAAFAFSYFFAAAARMPQCRAKEGERVIYAICASAPRISRARARMPPRMRGAVIHPVPPAHYYDSLCACRPLPARRRVI